jgi:hypothetical protein
LGCSRDLLAIDAALWGRRLFSHPTIDHALLELCRWPFERILLPHIGRSDHEALELNRHAQRQLCCPSGISVIA